MVGWMIFAHSTRQPTGSVEYKCSVVVLRDISQDTIDSTPPSSLYKFSLYLVRTSGTTRLPPSKWTVRHKLTGGLTGNIDSGDKSMLWPADTSNIQAGVPKLLFEFQAELANDGTSKTVTMLASREAGAPRDCNIEFTFSTAERYIKICDPTNVRWVSHKLSSGNIALAWDGADNDFEYRIDWFVNNSHVGYDYTQDIPYLFRNIDDILNPTDVFHARVQAFNYAGNKSNSIESPQLRYGDMAKIKIGSSWLHSQPYVKTLGSSNFKPVRAVWIKTTDGWVRALDD